MTTSLNNSVPGRDDGTQNRKVLVKQITYADADIAVDVGGLPANAIVVGGAVWVTTAFNAGGSDLVDVGYTDATATDADAYATDLDVSATGSKALDELGSTSGAPLTRATTVTATYSYTSTAPTAGAAYVIVEYVLPDIR